MSAERSTESIIDLLYGELSEEEAREVREDLAESDELQGDLLEFESLLGQVREAMPVADVSPAIHASIMEAARAGVQSNADDRMIRRAAPEQGFWSRVGRGQGSQIALVAAVLIAGLFVVKAVDRGSSPLHAPAGDISSMEEAAPAMAAPPAVVGNDETVPEATEEKPEGGEAIADQWSEKPNEAPAPAALPIADSPTNDDVKSSLREELGLAQDRNRLADTRSPAKSSKPTSAAPKPEPAPKRRSAKRKKAKPSPDKEMDAVYIGDLDRDDSYGGKGLSSSTSTRSGSKPDVDSMLQGVDSTKLPRDSEPAKAEAKAPKEAEARPAPAPAAQAAAEDEKLAYRAPANSLDEVSSYFRAGDYGGTVRAADNFLAKNKSASSMDRASAMFFKAQSLEKQGKYSAAQRIYESIQKNYPTYESNQVERALNEVKKKNVRKPAPKSKRKADAAEKSAPDSSSVFSE